MTNRYTLLAVTGVTPQIVTETVYALHHQGHGLPSAVHVVTTRVGRDFLDAVLLGHPRSYKHRPIEPAGPGWDALADRLGHPLPPIEVHVVARPDDPAPLDDLRSTPDARLAADLLYRTVHALTTDGSPPLVASLAGGRKTLSADLQSAFSVYARPLDRLVHILVAPDSYEHDRSFLFPRPDTPDARLDLVDVTVPRLRRLLDDHLLDALPADRRGLNDLVDALRPRNYTTPPVSAEVAVPALDRAAAPVRLRLLDPDGHELDALPLKASDAATLLALAEAFADGPADADALTHGDVNNLRSEVLQLATFDEATPWRSRRAVSTAISNLNRALDALPIARDALCVTSARGTNGSPTSYHWANGGLPLAVRPENASWAEATSWPFEHVPLVTPAPQA